MHSRSGVKPFCMKFLKFGSLGGKLEIKYSLFYDVEPGTHPKIDWILDSSVTGLHPFLNSPDRFPKFLQKLEL